MSARSKLSDGFGVAQDPVAQRLLERGFLPLSLPRFFAVPTLPHILQEKYIQLTTQYNDRILIGSRCEMGGWVRSNKPRLNIASIWRWLQETGKTQ